MTSQQCFKFAVKLCRNHLFAVSLSLADKDPYQQHSYLKGAKIKYIKEEFEIAGIILLHKCIEQTRNNFDMSKT
jgi:hypothetical protein